MNRFKSLWFSWRHACAFYCMYIPTGRQKWLNKKVSFGNLASPSITNMTYVFLYSYSLPSLYLLSLSLYHNVSAFCTPTSSVFPNSPLVLFLWRCPLSRYCKFISICLGLVGITFLMTSFLQNLSCLWDFLWCFNEIKLPQQI